MSYKFKIPEDIGQFDVKAIEGDWYENIVDIENIKEVLDKNKIDIIKDEYEKYVDDDSQKFFNKMSFIVATLIICPPIGIVFMCAYGKNSKISKLIISIIFMILNIIFLCIVVGYLKTIFK